MDTGRLVNVIEQLILEEADLGIQRLLNAARVAIQGLANNPSDQNAQIIVQQSLDDLGRPIANLRYEKDPIFASYVKTIGGERFFSQEMANEIRESISNNGMTPAVSLRDFEQLIGERQNFLTTLQNFVESSRNLQIGADKIAPGETQIGFRVPRELFHNELKGWTNELNEIRHIIRPFSEVATGGAEPIHVGEISSSDPIVFLILNASTVALLAKAVSWSLDQWKKVEEIRKLRAETRKLSAETGGKFDDMADAMEVRAREIVTQEIDDFAKLLVPVSGKAGRSHELRTDMVRALTSLAARIERGVTVEIKLLAPDMPDENDSTLEGLEAVIPALRFPGAAAAPILALPHAPANDG